MILVDTGPCIALFDPKDAFHLACRRLLQTLRPPLLTTVPVLTEAFHLLSPASPGAKALRVFVQKRGLNVWPLDEAALERAFALMEQYADHPMDLADASLITAAEMLKTRKIFTLDRADFFTYRIRIGHHLYAVEILSCEST